MSDVQHLSQYLATNILELRRKQNLSQNQLAKLSEIPRSTLTHLESGAGNPSLQNMARLAGALGVSIEELVSRPREDCQHLSAAQIPVKSRRGGQALFHKLLPDKLRGLEFDKLELEPLVSVSGKPHLQGTKEYFYCELGEIKIHVAGQAYNIKKGEVLAFPGDQPHSYQNMKSKKSMGFSVVVPVPAQI